MEDRVKQLMADVFGIDAELIDQFSDRDNLAGWTSLSFLTLCFSIEQEFSIRLEIPEIESMDSFKKIVETVQAKSTGE
jgi:acyl carrier protein